MFCSDVMNQFHNQYGFTNAGTTEETNLTTLYIRGNKVNDLDACFQDVCFWRQVIEFRGWAVNRPMIFSFYFCWIMVYGFTQNVEDTAQYSVTYWYGNSSTCIDNVHITCEAVCGGHGYTAHCVITQMLHNFNNNSVFDTFTLRFNVKGIINGWQLTWCKLNVYNWADNLYHFTNISTHLRSAPILLQRISATHNFRDFVSNASLTQFIIFKAEFTNEFRSIICSGCHSSHTRP